MCFVVWKHLLAQGPPAAPPAAHVHGTSQRTVIQCTIHEDPLQLASVCLCVCVCVCVCVYVCCGGGGRASGLLVEVAKAMLML